MSEPEVVSKAAFAAMRNVSAARVSQWLGEGKIGPEALVGEGRFAKINVALAIAQLQERLDTSQRFGLNGITTNLNTPAPAPAAIATPPPATQPTQPLAVAPPDTVEAQIKAEKLRQTVLATRRLEEDDRARRGVYVLARQAREEHARIAAEMFKAFDGALADMAGEIAAAHQLPSRDVLHALRRGFRRTRERMAAEYRAAAGAEPETLEDVESHDEPPLQ